MKTIVDSNILFSAAITPTGKVAELMHNPSFRLERLCCYYAIIELFKHQAKIISLAKNNPEDTLELLYGIIRQLTFVNESLISDSAWASAHELTKDVDNQDIAHVALTLHTQDGYLWTGDKKLIAHLRKLDFEFVITTDELYQLVNQ